MAFDSFSAFIMMEGHGPYVWTCYGAFFLLLVLLARLSVMERRQVIRRQQLEQNIVTAHRQAGDDMRLVGGSFQRIPTTQSESSSKP